MDRPVRRQMKVVVVEPERTALDGGRLFALVDGVPVEAPTEMDLRALVEELRQSSRRVPRRAVAAA